MAKAKVQPHVPINYSELGRSANEIARAIIEIHNGMKALDDSPLSRDAIVTLIAWQSKITRKDINIVLNNLLDLRNDWLKPPPKQTTTQPK